MTSATLPSSAQVSKAIQEVREEGDLAKASREMSQGGRKFAADVEKLLTDIQMVIEEKSPNDELQKVVQYGAEVASATKEGLGKPGAKEATTAGESAKDAATETARHVAKLATTIVQIPQFRESLWDMVDILQEILDYNTGGGVSETTDQAQKLKESAYGIKNETATKVSDDVSSSLAQGQSLADTAKRAIDVVAGGVEKNVPEPILRQANQAAQRTAQAVQQGEDVFETVKKVGEEQYQRAQEMYENAEITEEQKQKIFLKLQEIFEHVRTNPDVSRGFDCLVESYKDFQKWSQVAVKEAKEQGRQVKVSAINRTRQTGEAGKSSTELLMENAQKLIENIAGGRSLDPFLEKLYLLVNKTTNDQRLAEYMREILNYLKMPLDDVKRKYEEGMKEVDAAKYGAQKAKEMRLDEKFSQVADKIRTHVSKHYQDEAQAMLFEGAAIMRAIAEDDTITAFGKDVKSITKDLFYDQATGKPRINYELWPEVVGILPILADKFAYLPIPRIESNDENGHLIMDHIILKCSGIIPDHIQINTEVAMDKPGSQIIPDTRNKAEIHLSGIQASCKDVAWMYRRKKGFTPWSDVGLMDMDISGNGIIIDMTVSAAVAPSEKQLGQQEKKEVRVNVLKATAKITGLNVVFRETRHDFLYAVFRPMINRAIRKRVEEEMGKWLSGMHFDI